MNTSMYTPGLCAGLSGWALGIGIEHDMVSAIFAGVLMGVVYVHLMKRERDTGDE